MPHDNAHTHKAMGRKVIRSSVCGAVSQAVGEFVCDVSCFDFLSCKIKIVVGAKTLKWGTNVMDFFVVNFCAVFLVRIANLKGE